MSVQFWTHWFPIPGEVERIAVRAEELGFDGLLLADSQNLVGDPLVELGLLARRTSRLGLGTGVTNPVTRHPAVLASAMATLQLESAGRAVLGLGRGDSALAQVGLSAPTTDRLAKFLSQVRGLLRGETVDLDGHQSRLSWLAEAELPPVPVELAATGPKTIALAATASDRVMLTIGADPQRISAAIDHARAARTAAGLDPAQLSIGAYVNVGCHPDPAAARDLVRGSAAIFAHFGSMSGRARQTVSAEDARVIDDVGRSYREDEHGLSTAPQVNSLDDAFLDRFAVVGSPADCQKRLSELVSLGLDRIVLVPGSRDNDRGRLDDSNARLGHEVLPDLR